MEPCSYNADMRREDARQADSERLSDLVDDIYMEMLKDKHAIVEAISETIQSSDHAEEWEEIAEALFDFGREIEAASLIRTVVRGYLERQAARQAEKECEK